MQVPAVFRRAMQSIGIPMRASSYEAAGTGRRSKTMTAPGSGPNRSLSYSLETLRNRSRAADRNNAWLWLAVDRLVSNEVGIGVTLRSRAEDLAFREAANRLWARSSQELDAEGLLNFGGIQAQAVRARRVAGEVFIRRRRRDPILGLAVPMQIQVLEAEYVPLGYSRDLDNGNYVRDGIEYNLRGARAAYWMHTSHPNDDGRIGFENLVRISASDVIHHFAPTRPGQRRGEPNSARSLLGAHTFDSYEDAELVRKQTRAPFTGAIYRDSFETDWKFDPFTGQTLTGALDPESNVEPGSFIALAPGEKLELFDGDDNGAGLAEYSRQTLLKICAGFGVPYEVATGDWSKVNDRLVRAIQNEFRRSIEAAQDHLLIFQICSRVWSWWLDAAVFSGALEAPGYATARPGYQALQARPHGWAYVNPLQDVQAKTSAINAGLTSRQIAIDEQPGPSADEIDRQISEDQMHPFNSTQGAAA